ncbi:MAG: protein kinase domain-containing protein [Phycisphaerales bacterium]
MAQEPVNPLPVNPAAMTAPSPALGQSPPLAAIPSIATTDLLPLMRSPARVGRYILGARLGGGGFGAVYEATHSILKTPAAIKLMHRVAGPAQVEDFKREARRVSRLSGHPGIIEVRDFGLSRDSMGQARPYLVMNRVRGARSLTRYAKDTNLDLPARLRLMVSAAEAVHFAHEHGVIHLDLKPANLPVHEPAGAEPARPIVVDFGIARAADPDADRVARCDLAGTVPYMSPEQTRLGAVLDRRSDVYSLGVVLYELLCGMLPYGLVGVEHETAYRVIRETPPDLTSPAPASLPADVRTILARALAKHPQDRYPTAGDLARDLRAVLDGDRPSERRRTLYGRALAAGRRALLRRPALGVLLTVLASLFLTDLIGEPLANQWFPGESLSLRAFAALRPPGPLQHVTILARDRAAYSAQGIPIGPEPGQTKDEYRAAVGSRLVEFRSTLAAALEALATAPPRAVALDIHIAGPGPDAEADARLIRAVERLRAAGTSIVCALRGENTAMDGDFPAASAAYVPMTRAAGRWGVAEGVTIAPTMGSEEQRTTGIMLLRGTRSIDPTPSLALETYAAALAPKLKREYALDYDLDRVVLQFAGVRGPGAGSDPTAPGPEQSIRVTATTVDNRQGLEVFEAIAFCPLGAAEHYERASVGLTAVARADPAALARLRNTVVVICDTAGTVDDHKSVEGGVYPGGYWHARAIEHLFNNSFPRAPTFWGESALAVLLTLVGAGAVTSSAPARRWWPRRYRLGLLALGGIIAAIILLGTLVSAAWLNHLVNPLILLFACAMGAVFMTLVHWIRSRAVAVKEPSR